MVRHEDTSQRYQSNMSQKSDKNITRLYVKFHKGLRKFFTRIGDEMLFQKGLENLQESAKNVTWVAVYNSCHKVLS